MKSLIKKILDKLGYKIVKKNFYEMAKNNERLILYGEISKYFGSEKFDFFLKSKSQILQDYFVASYFKFKKKGVFIEFGATDGIKDSNTFLLESEYDWRGILVEPIKDFYLKLKNNRSSKCINKVVYNRSNEKIIFQELKTKELSTIKGFGKNDGHKRHKLNSSEYEVESISLNDLIKNYVPNKKIDYLSIDTEGSEYDILKAFNFQTFKVEVISIEHNFSINRKKIFKLLTSNGYKRVLEKTSLWDDYYVLEKTDETR